MLNIYNKIKKDFDFLSEFGYKFDYIEHHNVMPSIMFRRNSERIQIGIHYDDRKMFVLYYSTDEQLLGENLVENLEMRFPDYKNQVSIVKTYLISLFTDENL